MTADYVEHYNEVRLHSAIDYVTPADRMAKRHRAILAQRKHKLIEARKRRRSGKTEATIEVGVVGENRQV